MTDPIETPQAAAALPRVVYLHGFASSAASTKAAYFAARLGRHGIQVETPDFNQPDFSSLTITRMIDQVSRSVTAHPGGPVALVGSSLGAFVAVQVALQVPVSRMVLLAPALEFPKGDVSLGDRSIADWERTGVTNVFHYGYGRVIPLNFALYTDACGYDCVEARLSMPILIFQGRRDTVVDPASVERWARPRPNVELHLLDDDHQLGGSLEYMGREVERFLGLANASS